MGGPPNTFTGATQPIPVRGDGSAQAGLPDAKTGRDTRGVVNKYSTLHCVSPHAMRLRVRLDNDVLNIIGEYVKKDNIDRMEKEEDFKIVNNFFCFGISIYIRLIIFFTYKNFL
jgi:hypothetical protein